MSGETATADRAAVVEVVAGRAAARALGRPGCARRRGRAKSCNFSARSRRQVRAPGHRSGARLPRLSSEYLQLHLPCKAFVQREQARSAFSETSRRSALTGSAAAGTSSSSTTARGTCCGAGSLDSAATAPSASASCRPRPARGRPRPRLALRPGALDPPASPPAQLSRSGGLLHSHKHDPRPTTTTASPHRAMGFRQLGSSSTTSSTSAAPARAQDGSRVRLSTAETRSSATVLAWAASLNQLRQRSSSSRPGRVVRRGSAFHLASTGPSRACCPSRSSMHVQARLACSASRLARRRAALGTVLPSESDSPLSTTAMASLRTFGHS